MGHLKALAMGGRSIESMIGSPISPSLWKKSRSLPHLSRYIGLGWSHRIVDWSSIMVKGPTIGPLINFFIFLFCWERKREKKKKCFGGRRRGDCLRRRENVTLICIKTNFINSIRLISESIILLNKWTIDWRWPNLGYHLIN